MFQMTLEQKDALGQTLALTDVMTDHVESDASPCREQCQSNHSDMDATATSMNGWEKQLDQEVFRLVVALVQHRVSHVYDNALISFCAVTSSIVNREDRTITHVSENQMAGVLSKLVYGCQLIILQKAHQLVEQDHTYDEMGDALKPLCDAWILNHTRGPVGTLNDWRLYTMKVASSTVPPALTIWDEDGRVLTYGTVRYGWQDLADEMSFSFRAAQDLLHQELCFGFTDVPTYPMSEIRDNWSAWRAGFSFLDDPRNATYWEGHEQFLLERLAQSPSWTSTIFQDQASSIGTPTTRGTDSPPPVPRHWLFRSQFARQYQTSVEQFLEHMLVLVHKGSGQPARRVEFLGTRWRNIGTATRSLLIHSGYLVFMLSYHKSQARTHASRYPVRVIYPAVAQMLIQFLKLVQPLRLLLSHDTNIPSRVGDYLWSDGEQPWSEERMTRILQSMSRRSLGKEISVASWRQIAVGFALKRFSGMHYELDADMPGNHDDDNNGEAVVADGITLPAAFHAQSTHGASTGNRAYGTTVNYSSGLTDAGLQTYLWASKLWWSLFENTMEQKTSSKRERPVSMSAATPNVVKRVAHHVRGPRHRRVWGSETVKMALQRLYSNPAAEFRSSLQRQMVELVAAHHAEIVIVIPTGGGKSLSFMVPALLPRAGTTVVVLPLVALKQDMVRRCWVAGIDYSIWDAHGQSDRFVGTPLLFVAAEQAIREPFRRFLGRLDALQQLDRVVFDESHLILTASSYRPKMALLRDLRDLRCQFVFLSATLPPLLMLEFEKRLLLDSPRILRAPTFRVDLHYDVRRQSQPGDFREYMIVRLNNILQRFSTDEQARVIVYVQSREEARTMAGKMQCEYYFSDSGTPDEKQQTMARWRDGIHRIIFATSAFGTGVDYAHVRMVIHQGLPRDAINFAQEIGRAGRDGQGGSSYIILPHAWQAVDDSTWHQEQHSTPTTTRVLQRYVGQNRCLWATLSRFLDGSEQMQYCSSHPGPTCGVCQVMGTFDPSTEEDHTLYWDLPRSMSVADERSVLDATEEDEDGGDDGAATAIGLRHGGPSRLRQSVREHENGRHQYLEACQRWSTTCMICHLLFARSGSDHTLEACRRQEKWQFFRVKSTVQKQQRTGWMRSYVACWSCGQPPTICDGSKAPRGCQFRDMVLPSVWALYHMPHLWGRRLAEVSESLEKFSDDIAWLAWAGQECEVFGERSIHAVRMLAWVLRELETGVSIEP